MRKESPEVNSDRINRQVQRSSAPGIQGKRTRKPLSQKRAAPLQKMQVALNPSNRESRGCHGLKEQGGKPKLLKAPFPGGYDHKKRPGLLPALNVRFLHP